MAEPFRTPFRLIRRSNQNGLRTVIIASDCGHEVASWTSRNPHIPVNPRIVATAEAIVDAMNKEPRP
jgi:hypothetical protein